MLAYSSDQVTAAIMLHIAASTDGRPNLSKPL